MPTKLSTTDAPLTTTMTSIELVACINNERKKDAEQAGAAFPSKGFAKLAHKNFLAKVPKVLGAETSAKFLADLPDGYGRLQSAYSFPKREACLMAMSYSYELQAKVFDKMTALEEQAQLARIKSLFYRVVRNELDFEVAKQKASNCGRELRKWRDDKPRMKEELKQLYAQLQLPLLN